jgi:hypothetical protein
MVIGRVHRLGLPKRVNAYSHRVRHVATKPRATKPKVTLVPPKVKQLKQLADRMKADLLPEAKPMPRIPFNDDPHEGFRLIDLADDQCRYPINDAKRPEDHRFCGAPSKGTYCPAHEEIVWQPRRRGQHFRLQDRRAA